MATLVVQISRGMAPARCIAEVARAAHVRTMQYRLVHGLGAVEAKNEAARLALEHGDDLILVEDDSLIPFEIWTAAVGALEAGAVATVDAACRNGQASVRWRNGEFLFAGTVMVAIPAAVLSRLQCPHFIAGDFKTINGVLEFAGENDRGQGSDVWFWRQLLALKPPPEVRVLGRVRTVRHPYNTGSYDLTKPCEMEVVE